MIGGIVIDWIAKEDTVTFSVMEEQSGSICRVKAIMSKGAQRLIDLSAPIWWESENVYLTIGDITDCKFPKVGFTY